MRIRQSIIKLLQRFTGLLFGRGGAPKGGAFLKAAMQIRQGDGILFFISDPPFVTLKNYPFT